MKRIISILLTIILVCCITASVTLNALAATTDKIESNLTYTDRYGSWTYELTSNKKGYKITDYDESMSQIQIPSVINNLPVLEIGNRAFSYCSGLYSITIPNSIKTIDNYAFINCTSLTNITLMNGVATIGDQAFRNCSSLTSITIPESVTTIGSSTFEDCNSLASINVSSNNKNYSSIDGVLFNKTQSKLIRYPIKKLSDNYIIPSSVTDIGNRAFYNCDNLISITIPESVTTMGDYVFEICNNLTNITILNGVTNIGLQAFNGCSSLTSITLPNSVKTIGSKAFIGCKNLTSIIISNSVTTIGSSAFYNCYSLTSISIPNSVTTIGSFAFYGCSRLASITLPYSVTYIGYGAFAFCSRLNDVYYTGSENKWKNISIDEHNDYLSNATIHFNYGKVLGDTSGDGEIAVDDVVYVLKYVVGNVELTDEQLGNADLNDDGKLTILDAIMVQRLILELV